MSVPIISVVGPTASGKTALGVALAKQIGAEVISLDSMQIYRQMDIGTAKITREEMMGVPHHMIDILQPTEKYSVRQFTANARVIIDDLLQRGVPVVLVGGTGLYLDHLIRDTKFVDLPTDTVVREKLSRKSPEVLYEDLSAVDPVSAARLHPNDKKRVIRALEIYHTSGKTASYWIEQSHVDSHPLNALLIGLSPRDRSTLYRNIDTRVDKMIRDGLEREVRRLLELDGFLGSTAAEAIGYKEMIAYVQGRIALSQATELIKRNTRRYAKRQLTWFRHEENIHWLISDRPLRELLDDALRILADNS